MKNKYFINICLVFFCLLGSNYRVKATTLGEDYFLQQYQKGLSLVNDKKEQDAIKIWENALYKADSLHINSSISLANITKDMANIYWKKGNYSSVLKYLTKSYIYLEEIKGEEALKAKVSKALGICYQALYNPREAIKFYSKTLEYLSNTKEQNYDYFLKIYKSISECSDYMLDYENAILYKEKEVDVILKYNSNNTARLLELYKELGHLFFRQSSYKEAITYYNKALYISNNIIDNNTLSEIYNYIGISYYYLASYQKSIEYYLMALSIAEKNKANDEYLMRLYSSIGSSYDAIDSHEDAFSYKKKALELCLISPQKKADNLILAYNNLANTYHYKEKYKQSLKYSLMALDISKKYQNDEATIKIYFNIGQLYMSNKILDSAMYFFDKGLAHCTNYNYPQQLADKNYFLLSKSNVYLIQNKIDKATETFEKIHSEPDLKVFKESVFDLRKQYVQALILEKKNQYETAIKQINMCDSVALSINQDFYDDADRLAYVALVHDIHAAGVRLAHKIYKKNDDKKYINLAFFFAERSKMQVLLQTMSDNKLREAAGLPDSLQRKEKTLIHQLKMLQQEFADVKAKDKNVQDSLEIYYLQKYKEYQYWVAQTMTKYPKYFELSKGQKPIKIPDLQAKIQYSDAFVSYSVSDSATYAFIVTSSDIKFIKLPQADSLQDKIRNIRRAIMIKSDEDFIPISRQLYKEIWQPIQQILNENIQCKNVVIIPDGALLYLPFDALILPKKSNENFEYLLKNYTIAYQYSTTLWSEKRNPNTANSKASLAAFAPVFGHKLDQWHPTQTLRGGRDVKDIMNVEPLPATEQEVEKLDSLFGQNTLNKKIFLRRQASEIAVKSLNLKQYKYLHFATHGIISDKNPDFSGLLLLRDSLSENDGKLYASEIYGLQLNADLAVLSACESGLGKLVQGEGLVGLSRSFLYAGASNLSVSLWRVADEPTRLLMTYFYEYILQQSKLGKPIRYAEALQQAKLKLIRTSPYGSPYHWSAFILIGL